MHKTSFVACLTVRTKVRRRKGISGKYCGIRAWQVLMKPASVVLL